MQSHWTEFAPNRSQPASHVFTVVFVVTIVWREMFPPHRPTFGMDHVTMMDMGTGTRNDARGKWNIRSVGTTLRGFLSEW